MCTRDKEFTIRGIGDCLARGYDRTGFRSNPLATSGGASPVIGTPAIALGRAGSTAPLGARTQ
jgi:hypothetical protein